MKTNIIIPLLSCIMACTYGQNHCNLIAPDSIRPINSVIFYDEPAVFIVHGGTRSHNVWFSFYEDYCCEHILRQATQDTVILSHLRSGILWCRIESFCDTSRAVGIDIDVILSVEKYISTTHYLISYYDMLGKLIFTCNEKFKCFQLFSSLAKGCYIQITPHQQKKICKI